MFATGQLIIGLSGQAGSGKSTLAQFLTEQLNAETAAFGDFVRYLAACQGASIERMSLQEIGQAAVRSGTEEFVSGFIAWAAPSPGRAFVVDGIRHVAIDKAIRTWAANTGRKYVAVTISASEEVRAQRRTNGDRSALATLDGHPVETESVTSLPLIADFVVDQDWDGDALLQMILDFASG
jgi:energy-coupling factor transporter ATP-binding protein EcfA2